MGPPGTKRRKQPQTPTSSVRSEQRNGSTTKSGNTSNVVSCSREDQRRQREAIVLWKSPAKTMSYFSRELWITLTESGTKLWRRKFLVLLVLSIVAAAYAACSVSGPHQQSVRFLQKRFFWCAYWVGLGVLSSVGLGTGLHTFLLYLGPHIASVTLAAYECGTLRFPEPPYPEEIVCPDEEVSSITSKVAITMWSIMSKVRLEAFMWGAGTALGELPPYFMARAARLSGFDADEEELEEFEELLHQRENPESQSIIDRAKLAIQKLVERVGFVGILACASIPNPLFDLAGITCGHFLVPFWTFFGATLIGKAVIKMHIQKLFVIIAFNEALVEKAVNLTENVPHVGKYLHTPFRDFLQKQKSKLHRKSGSTTSQESSWLSAVFEKVVVAMIVYFVLSIVNSMAQRYHKRLCQSQRESVKKLATD